MEDLPEQEKKINIVDDLEIQYYEVQLEYSLYTRNIKTV